MSEWKPGDVALVRGLWVRGAQAQAHRAVRENSYWSRMTDGATLNDVAVIDARPLVVIDPEDAEQVERLHDLVMHTNECVAGSLVRGALTYGHTAAALREFARPTPTIEEPQLVGAIVRADVEYQNGKGWGPGLWALCEDGTWSSLTDGCTEQNVAWEFFSNVRILSPGVES